MAESNSTQKKVRNYIRLSLLLLILPILYLGAWFSIFGDESLTYFEKVQLLMSYFPESMRNPFGIVLTFFGMSLTSAIFSFYGFLKGESKFSNIMTISIFTVAALLTFLLGISLL
ncbi:MAG: hypothetical protein WD022_03950 [Balneolaceae bacterium]